MSIEWRGGDAGGRAAALGHDKWLAMQPIKMRAMKRAMKINKCSMGKMLPTAQCGGASKCKCSTMMHDNEG